MKSYNCCPVGWGCRIQRPLFCRWVRNHNECSGYDTKQSDCEVPVILKFWGMLSNPSLPSLPSLLWSGVIASDRVLIKLIMGQIKLNCVFMLNWIACNRTVLTFKLRTYAKMNCLKWNCFCKLNWIVMLELFGMRSTPSLPSLPGPLWPGMVAPDRILSMVKIELNCVITINWIACDRTVLTFKLRTYAKMNCLKWNCFGI